MIERRAVGDRSRRWDERLAARAYADGWWTREPLGDALRRAAQATPGRTLVTDGDVSVTCADLLADAERLAWAMLAHCPAGGVVSFMLPNWHEAARVYFAAALAGVVVHPILPQLRERDLAFMLADIDSRMIFIPAELRGRDYRAMLAEVSGALACPPLTVVVRGAPLAGQVALAALGASGSTGRIAPLPPVDPDAVSMILYTSGTTGTPKGVLHSHNSLHALARQMGEHWLIEPGDLFYVPSPISHIGGSIYAFELPVLLGTGAMLTDRWDAAAAVRVARARPFTHLAGATPFLEQLLAAARSAGDRLPALKLFVCGGAAVPPALVEQAAAWFGSTAVTRAYGSTEVPVIAVGTVDRADVAHAAHTDGRLGVAAVRLKTHPAAGSGEGEIWARGPQMLAGYVHAEDEAGLFDEDGFYRTGDIGRFVDGGFLAVTGRAKDIIIRNGENIAPKEIEDELAHLPGVAEAALVGLPDARTGERACLVIVAGEGGAPGPAAIADFLRGRGVASFKLPEQLEVWDALPKNAAGKVLKHAIRARLTAAALER